MSTAAAFAALMGCTAGLLVGAVVCFAWEAAATPRSERPSRLMFAGACVLSMTLIPLGGMVILNHMTP